MSLKSIEKIVEKLSDSDISVLKTFYLGQFPISSDAARKLVAKKLSKQLKHVGASLPPWDPIPTNDLVDLEGLQDYEQFDERDFTEKEFDRERLENASNRRKRLERQRLDYNPTDRRNIMANVRSNQRQSIQAQPRILELQQFQQKLQHVQQLLDQQRMLDEQQKLQQKRQQEQIQREMQRLQQELMSLQHLPQDSVAIPQKYWAKSDTDAPRTVTAQTVPSGPYGPPRAVTTPNVTVPTVPTAPTAPTVPTPVYTQPTSRSTKINDPEQQFQTVHGYRSRPSVPAQIPESPPPTLWESTKKFFSG